MDTKTKMSRKPYRKHKVYNDDDRKKVIDDFYNHKDNSDREVAERTGYSHSFVCMTIAKHLKNKFKKFKK